MHKKCFDFDSYKEFVSAWIGMQPKLGRGLHRKLASHLRIHSTMMSHILRGKQNLTEDQALLASEFMGLNETETEYFMELVRLDRAVTPKLKARIRKRLLHLRELSREVKNRISVHHELGPEDSARFYSSWFYSALRLLTDIPEFQSRGRLLEAFDIPRDQAQDALNFLIDKGLVREIGDRLTIGPSRTHLGADSPYVWVMHKNWRLKAMEKHSGTRAGEDLFYSAPMSVSKGDLERIREILLQAIGEMTKIAGQSEAEALVGMNLDFFRLV